MKAVSGRWQRCAVALAAAVVLAASPMRAQERALSELLDRAGAYVLGFVEDLSNIVADEEMTQRDASGPTRRTRRLKSDFLLVKYPGAERIWLQFRDVFEVNGRPVRDQQERLTRLFMEPFQDAVKRAREISQDASRHSLVELGPDSNPLFLMALLQPGYRPEYDFQLGDSATRNGVAVRELRLEEKPPVPPVPIDPARPWTPIRGKLWVEEKTGRVTKTELRTGRPGTARVSSTTFRFDAGLGIDVPADMDQMREWTEVRINATYTRFRRFQIRTEEVVAPVPPAPTNR